LIVEILGPLKVFLHGTVVGLVWSHNPESYAGGRATLVLSVGVGHGANNPTP